VDGVERRILSELEADPPEWIVSFPDRWDIWSFVPDLKRMILERYRPETQFTWRHNDVRLLRLRPPRQTGRAMRRVEQDAAATAKPAGPTP